jgi:hypothetical protein
VEKDKIAPKNIFLSITVCAHGGIPYPYKIDSPLLCACFSYPPEPGETFPVMVSFLFIDLLSKWLGTNSPSDGGSCVLWRLE